MLMIGNQTPDLTVEALMADGRFERGGAAIVQVKHAVVNAQERRRVEALVAVGPSRQAHVVDLRVGEVGPAVAVGARGGIVRQYRIADEGLGPRAVPTLKGHPALARHMAESLVNEEFDISVFQDLPIDHGCHSPLTMFWPPAPDWPGRIVPIEMNVLQHPLPTPGRCYKLGQAVRRAIESYPEALKVVVVGTGGLSHQLNGERAGFNNMEWDLRFLDLIDRDPRSLAQMKHADYIRLGGTEGAEEIMWLAMRGALSGRAKKIHQNCYLPMTASMAVALFEEPAKKASRKSKVERKTPKARSSR